MTILDLVDKEIDVGYSSNVWFSLRVSSLSELEAHYWLNETKVLC